MGYEKSINIIMKQGLLFVFFISFSYLGRTTPQIPDKIIFELDTIYLNEFPLEQYYENRPIPDFYKLTGCISSGCWRGYKALWEIKDNKLFLNSLYTCCESTYLSISDKVAKKMKKKLPDDVFKIITNYINKRVDKYKLYEELNKASSNEIWEKNYGYLYINTIEKNCKNIIVENEIPKEKLNFPNNEIIFANWYTGVLTFEVGNVKNVATNSYFEEREFEVKLRVVNGIVVEKTVNKT